MSFRDPIKGTTPLSTFRNSSSNQIISNLSLPQEARSKKLSQCIALPPHAPMKTKNSTTPLCSSPSHSLPSRSSTHRRRPPSHIPTLTPPTPTTVSSTGATARTLCPFTTTTTCKISSTPSQHPRFFRHRRRLHRPAVIFLISTPCQLGASSAPAISRYLTNKDSLCMASY